MYAYLCMCPSVFLFATPFTPFSSSKTFLVHSPSYLSLYFLSLSLFLSLSPSLSLLSLSLTLTLSLSLSPFLYLFFKVCEIKAQYDLELDDYKLAILRLKTQLRAVCGQQPLQDIFNCFEDHMQR